MSIFNISPFEIDVNIPHKEWGYLSRRDILDWLARLTEKSPYKKGYISQFVKNSLIEKINKRLYITNVGDEEYHDPIVEQLGRYNITNISNAVVNSRTAILVQSGRYAETICDGVLDNISDDQINHNLKEVEESIMHPEIYE